MIICCSTVADAQDLSRYRQIAFGSTVTFVTSVTGSNARDVKVIHQRPALIQELAWKPQYAVGRPAGRIEAAREIVFRFFNDQLFGITVLYDARLVEGMTDTDIIESVSTVYGAATLPAAGLTGQAQPPPWTANGSTEVGRWQSADYEFTLMREVFPATFRLVGISLRVEAEARQAETEAARLDKEEAPRREAERALVDGERKRAAAEKTRTTNKTEFRP
jgi:hypothetical protein